jgi:predicted transcriptional regulator
VFKDLIGDLSGIRLFNLVKPLVDGKKSGLMAVRGKEVAELYIEGGQIVHARTGTLNGEEALLPMMDLDNGRVTFNWQTSPEERTVRLPTEQVMSNWSQREEEWKMIRPAVPSAEAVFSLVVDSGGEDRTIPAGQWGVLALCNGRRKVSEMAGRLGRTVFDVSGTLYALVERGLVERTEAADIPQAGLRTTINEAFFEAAETELKKVVGPIARIILNDTLAAFEESREAFPKDRVKSFISTVCDQITEEPKREKFGKAIYVAWLSCIETS